MGDKRKYLFILYALAVTLSLSKGTLAQDTLRQRFLHPPASAKPWVFWYWMYAAVSKDGITADLQAMKDAGIGGAYLMPIKDTANPPYIQPPARQLSPEWWGMVRFALQEAKRLGLNISLHVSDGFALAGGPWISPELSMQKIVSSQLEVSGGRLFNDHLPVPPVKENYYRDIAVYAFPAPENNSSSPENIPVVTTSKPGINVQFLASGNSKESFRSDTPCWIQYAFSKPFTCRTIVIHTGGNNYQAQRLLLQVSDDGQQFRSIDRLQSPRHGWQDTDADVTHTIATTTARYFRFVYDKTGSEPGAEDLDAAKWKPALKLNGISLSSAPRIYQYEGKTAEVWRISPRTTAAQLPDSLCVPLNKLVNITANMDTAGNLVWQVPPGRWIILRMGHTATGHTNATGGGGKGLECDKFNPVAIKKQFDNWFGEALHRAGDSLAGVVKVLHVDSWECGSQNWSPVFRAAFKKKRGYDPLPYLPVMAGIPLQSAETSERFLYDVRNTVAELVNDSFYVTLSQLAHRHGCLLSAESVAPTMSSDGMLHYKTADIAMGEFWLRSPTHDKPNDMLDAISGAHIYGKNIVQAESFTELRMAWDEYPGMLKTLQDRNYALGINRLVYHVFTHNPWTNRKPGMTLDGIGLYFQRDQTWWKPAKAWVSYAQRCQSLLQVGVPVADIAVFTGEDIPRRAQLPDRLVTTLPGLAGRAMTDKEVLRLQNTGEPVRELPAGVFHSANMADAGDWLDMFHGYQYDSFNPDALLHLARVEKGRIALPGGASYAVLVIPGIQAMQPNATRISAASAQRILSLVKQGATILLAGPLTASTGLLRAAENDAIIRDVYMQLTAGPFRHIKQPGGGSFDMADLGKGHIIIAPFEAGYFNGAALPSKDLIIINNREAAQGITYTHRRAKGLDIYFVSNQLDTVQDIQVSLRVTGRIPELWDAVTGEIMEADKWNIRNGRTMLPIHLDAGGSVFIVLRKDAGKMVSPKKATTYFSYVTVQTMPSDWTIQFDAVSGGPAQPVIDTPGDWSRSADTAIRYYSGTAVYTQSFDWNGEPGRSWLHLGRVGVIAQVSVNGIDCGVAWTAPWRVDVTRALKKGKNNIRIEVTNTWANRLQGDHRLPGAQRTTWTTAPYRLLEGKPLPPSGLMGPVYIQHGLR